MEGDAGAAIGMELTNSAVVADRTALELALVNADEEASDAVTTAAAG